MTDTDLPAKLGKPAERALAAAGIHRLADLTAWTERDLAALHGVGPTAVAKLRTALAEHGQSFASRQ
ncbi:DNA-binding protein [Nocardia sp. NPDC052112]|uniref:DNA-binding protein n=1 Tax=Nocardia sp. NPDC052112 TaxID=3155646 RepID=UPI003428A51A